VDSEEEDKLLLINLRVKTRTSTACSRATEEEDPWTITPEEDLLIQPRRRTRTTTRVFSSRSTLASEVLSRVGRGMEVVDTLEVGVGGGGKEVDGSS